MISAADWQRMPWHAREKYLTKHRSRAARIVENRPEPERSQMLSERGITRCGVCGGWMYRSCPLHPDR